MSGLVSVIEWARVADAEAPLHGEVRLVRRAEDDFARVMELDTNLRGEPYWVCLHHGTRLRVQPDDLYAAFPDDPPAARDDAAELRAALAKMSDLVYTMLNAEDELSRVNVTGGSYPDDVMGYHAARRNAWRELQELAQEYDDPAALAASEGQP